MPHRICCSECQYEGRLLQGVSRIAWFDYYRCERCGHVWTHEKDKPDSTSKDAARESKAS